MILIDGSSGEGGGQILRTSLSLSLVTGRSFQITNIRGGRERPGLLRQHLAAILAAVQIGDAEVDGAFLGSTSLTFCPKTIKPGKYHFSVGTAGSGTLVLQTILPALMVGSLPSYITIEGGTHNMAAPPFDFLAKSFLPLIAKMGPKIRVELERYGFYPAGGGRFDVAIEPCDTLGQIHVADRGPVSRPTANAVVANLPRHIAQREVDAVAVALNCSAEEMRITETKNSPGPGNVVMVEVETPSVTSVFTAFGKLGLSAEKVATDAAAQAQAYLESDAAICEHLADQLLLPMALAGGGSFTVATVSSHAVTNMDVISKFIPAAFVVSEEAGKIRVVIVAGRE